MRRACSVLAAAALLACSSSKKSPPAPPPPPASVQAASPMPGTLRAWWTPAAGATGYAVYRAQGPIDPATATRVQVPAGASAGWSVSGLVPGSTWNVAVASLGEGGEGARSADASATVRPLAEITAADATATTVSLAWTPVSDGTYVLYRATASPVDPATATALPAATAALVDTVSPNTTYHYAVAAVYDGAESPLGPEWTVTTPPGAPATFGVAASGGAGTLTLTWSAVPMATSYTVLCATAAGLPDTATETASTTALTLELTGLQAGTRYWCAVRAESAAGPGDLGPELSALTFPAAPSPTAVALVGGASVGWAPVQGATAYVVYWASGTGEEVDAATACTAEACTWSRTDLGAGVPLELTVNARNASGDGPASATMYLTTLLVPPALSAAAGAGTVTLTWTDPNVPAAASYDLYWSAEGPVTLASTRIAGLGASPYVHAVPALGRTYRYAIVAVGSASSSPLSAEASATVARDGQLAAPVALDGITTFGQSIAPELPGDPVHFPGQSGYWDLQPDFSVALGGYDGPFAGSGAQILLLGRLATVPPTFDSLVGEVSSLDYFPYDQVHGELGFLTPVFDAATHGLALAAFSDGAGLVERSAPIAGARSAFLAPTSDSRLQQALDLRGVTAATLSWKQLVYLDPGRVAGDVSTFSAVLRDAGGLLLEALAPTCAPAEGVATCTATVGSALGQQAVLSFEFRGAAPGIVELDDVGLTGAPAVPALANPDFEGAGGWTTNAGAEAQNVTTGSRELCVDGPFALPCSATLSVTRSFFAAPTSPWARVVDVFENLGPAEVSADVVYVTVAAAGPTAHTYDPGGWGSVVAAFDASPTPMRDFAVVLGDAAAYHHPATPDGLTPGDGVVFAVRPIVVPAGGRVALASFLVMDGRYGRRGAGGVAAAAVAIADGFASTADSTYRDWLTQAQRDAIVNF